MGIKQLSSEFDLKGRAIRRSGGGPSGGLGGIEFKAWRVGVQGVMAWCQSE